MGWIGDNSQMLYALRIAGADTDKDGKVYIYGEAPAHFMGIGSEVVVPDGCMYSIDGQQHSVVGLMSATSYGSAVHVFGSG